MKLYEKNMGRFAVMIPVTEDDGCGGYITSYTDGAEFSASLIGGSMREYFSGRRLVKLRKYSVIVSPDSGFVPSFGDIFRSLDDGRRYIVTGERRSPPDISVIRFSVTDAEAWMEDENDEG